MFTPQTFLESPLAQPVLYPAEVLLKAAQPIEDIEPWKKIAPIMFDIMKRHRGCGLAAPQVGLPYKMFILQVTAPMVVINPEILEFGDRKKEVEEGCLSLPGQLFKITRPTKIRVRWLGLEGKENIATYEGWTSRAFQHEYDHLLGVLINNK